VKRAASLNYNYCKTDANKISVQQIRISYSALLTTYEFRNAYKVNTYIEFKKYDGLV